MADEAVRRLTVAAEEGGELLLEDGGQDVVEVGELGLAPEVLELHGHLPCGREERRDKPEPLLDLRPRVLGVLHGLALHGRKGITNGSLSSPTTRSAHRALP